MPSFLKAISGFVTGLGIWKYVALIGAAFSFIGGIYIKGRKDANAKQARKQAEAYKDARKDIDQADIAPDANTAREWMSERKK